MAAGGDSAGGNAVTQRGEIFLGRGGRAGFGPAGTTFGVSFVAQRSGLASARGVASGSVWAPQPARMCAAFSPIIIAGALVLPPLMLLTICLQLLIRRSSPQIEFW